MFFFVFQFFFTYLEKKQIARDEEQAIIILDDISDRFNLFLKSHIAIGIMGASYFSEQASLNGSYENFASNTFAFNPEILGLNLVDQKGKIVKVYPEKTNSGASGKTSQNFSFIWASFERHELYWVSPPFVLFQGEKGFAIYVPILKDKILKGWFAPVISTKLFIEHFKLNEFTKTYHLSIQDSRTGIDYISTGLPPKDEKLSNTHTYQSHGREIKIQVWRKDQTTFVLPKFYSLIGSLIISLLLWQIMRLNALRRSSRAQLIEISTLLQLTLKEALNNFMGSKSEANIQENVTYMSNLIEQINLLQTVANNNTSLKKCTDYLLPILKAALKNFDEVIHKKQIALSFDEEKFKGMSIDANGWLIQNSVLVNTLFHAIFFAEPNSSITLSAFMRSHSNLLKIHVLKVSDSQIHESIFQDRRIEVAKMALHMYGGDLALEKDLHQGIIITLNIPGDCKT